ncbi:MAG TPA: copper resistance protein CopC, partial [Ilumatobacter sp.]|nr:copper resistance protein CopC [Ilumatobacter sp.]
MGVRTCVPPPAGERRRPTVIPTTITAVRLAVVGFAAALAVLAGASPSAAQDTNSLREIDPANGAELEESPTVITLSFNQEIRDDDIPTVDLSCGGQPQATGLPEVDNDGIVVTATVTNPLPATSCLIAYSLRDGLGNNLVIGTSSFRVLNDPPSTTAAAGDTGATEPGATTTVDPFIRQEANPATTGTLDAESQGSTGGAIWFGRLLSTIGILVIFGGLAIISVGWPEGPEYLVTVRYFRLAWAIALIGTVIYLIAFAADFNDSSFGTAMSPSSWLDLKDAGWAGRGALLRLVFVIACWYVVSRPEHIIDPATAMWGWGIPLATVAVTALTRVEGPWPALGYLVNVAHLLAAGVWVGGAALVSRVVLAGPGEDDLV